MLIRYKRIEHENTSDAPFVSARISAIDCKFKCKGCFNQHLKKEPTLTATAEEIIAEIKSNPFNQGIILGGLEWSLQPLELVELVKVASQNGLQIMIYTGCDIKEFDKRIGIACADKVGYKEIMDKPVKSEEDYLLLAYIGGMVLDYYIPEDYYIKVGRYDREKLTSKSNFDVNLASENQFIIKFTRNKEVSNEN